MGFQLTVRLEMIDSAQATTFRDRATEAQRGTEMGSRSHSASLAAVSSPECRSLTLGQEVSLPVHILGQTELPGSSGAPMGGVRNLPSHPHQAVRVPGSLFNSFKYSALGYVRNALETLSCLLSQIDKLNLFSFIESTGCSFHPVMQIPRDQQRCKHIAQHVVH